jgi:hypothetical protein
MQELLTRPKSTSFALERNWVRMEFPGARFFCEKIIAEHDAPYALQSATAA